MGQGVSFAAVVVSVVTIVTLSAGRTHCEPINLDGRDVPFAVGRALQLSAGKTPRRSVADDTTLSARFALTAEQASRSYGLFVGGARAAAVMLNSRPLDFTPIERSDGELFAIPATLLHEGENLVEITGVPDDAASDLWAGSAMFSLRNTAEQAHFASFFGDSSSMLASPPAADSLQSKYDVLWYDCNWTPSMTTTRLDAAVVTMGARSLDSTLQTVVLDFNNNGGQLVVNAVDRGQGTGALPYTLDTTAKRLRITLPAPVASGTEFQVRVNYSGVPASGGTFGTCYTRTTHGSPAVAVTYTCSQPYDGRKWWPCKDLPDDKATTSIQRITIPSGAGWKAISNGSLQQVVNNGSTETWIWVNHYPISAYLISMAISNYIYSEAIYTSRDGSTTMPVRCYIYPENAASEGNGATGTRSVVNFFADTFGEYPFLQEKYYVANYQGSGMEHQTCTSIAVGWIGDGTQPINVHELAHQWFGDKVTCNTFDHVWLQEGMATYAEALWQEHIGGATAYHNYIATYAPTSTVPVIGPTSDSFFSAVVYDKGGWVFHMLRHVVGDTTFFQILRQYIASPTLAYGTALTSDLQAVSESVSGMNLTSFFNQWLYRPGSGAPGTGALYEPAGQPTYYYQGSSHLSGGVNYVDVHVQQTQSGTPYVMPIDIQIVYASGSRQTFVVNNSTASADYSLATGTQVPLEINFDPDIWILKTTALSINTCALMPAGLGASYSQTMRASNGTTPYTWSITSGTLPAGVSLSSTGVMSGTPTASGTYPVSVTVRDTSGVTRTTTLSLAVTAAAAHDWELY